MFDVGRSALRSVGISDCCSWAKSSPTEISTTEGRMPESSAILHRLFGLEGRVAVVVGGAGRIGSALCQGLSDAGAAVCVLDVDAAAAQELAEQIHQQTGRPTLALAADITQEEPLSEAVRRVSAALGPADIRVNSAQFRGAR